MSSVSLGFCLGMVAPFYNLVFVLIVIALFIKLFSLPNKKVYILPWKLLFCAIIFYLIEEALTVLAILFNFTIPRIVAPLLEMAIISLFIYMVLLQKEYVSKLK